MTEGALNSVRVLDLSRTIAGAYCTRLLADAGADVLKIEPPDGDPLRGVGPFIGNQPGPERSCLFHYINASKRSITVDIERPEGQRILRHVAAGRQIVVASSNRAREFPAVSIEALAQANEASVLVGITSFGRSGPYADFSANHATLAAMSGWTLQSGDPEREPLTPGGYTTHYLVGSLAAAAATMARMHAEETGEGHEIEISEYEVLSALSAQALGQWIFAEDRRSRIGRGYYYGAIVQAADSWLSLNGGQAHQFELLCTLLGVPELLADPRFAEPHLRRQNASQLLALIEERTRTLSGHDLFIDGQAMRIPTAQVPTPAELLANEQLTARGYWNSVCHPETGSETHPGAPALASGFSWAQPTPAPQLGQHNLDVFYSELGLSESELGRLRSAGVIGA